jgi:hypothetical protein
LAANLALEVADTGLLFDRDRDGVFVIAKEALEGAGELLLLQRMLVRVFRIYK